MQTAMTRGEIAQFLEITEQEVEDLWTSGALQQSLCNPLRPDAGFAFSAIYDVLEFALSSGHLPVVLTKELAALWVCNLAEADEWDEFALANWIEQAAYLARFAMEDGLHCRTTDAELTALVLISTREALVGICHEGIVHETCTDTHSGTLQPSLC